MLELSDTRVPQIGEQTNQRLLDAQLGACDCALDPTALARIVLPSIHDGLPAPSLSFGDPRVMVLLACLCHYGQLFNGLTNRSLRELIAGLIPGYTPPHRQPPPPRPSLARLRTRPQPQNPPGCDRGLKNMTRS